MTPEGSRLFRFFLSLCSGLKYFYFLCDLVLLLVWGAGGGVAFDFFVHRVLGHLQGTYLATNPL